MCDNRLPSSLPPHQATGLLYEDDIRRASSRASRDCLSKQIDRVTHIKLQSLQWLGSGILATAGDLVVARSPEVSRDYVRCRRGLCGGLLIRSIDLGGTGFGASRRTARSVGVDCARLTVTDLLGEMNPDTV